MHIQATTVTSFLLLTYTDSVNVSYQLGFLLLHSIEDFEYHCYVIISALCVLQFIYTLD